LVTLVISDIVGSPLDAIASGPTVPDPTTFVDALAILAKYRLTEQVPPAVLATLRRGATGEEPETPKPDDPTFARSSVTVLADNATAARAAVAEAGRLGYHTLLLSTYIEGEAREVGRTLARARARGFDPARHLAENDAYPLLDAVGDLIRIGPTNTNVNDLMLILCGEAPRAGAPTDPDTRA